MNVSDLVAAMGRIAPLALAESWDNVGLLVGTAGRPMTGPVLLTIDLTERGAGRGGGAEGICDRELPPAAVGSREADYRGRRRGAAFCWARSSRAWRSTLRTRRWMRPTGA
jgi:hypothetical protein